MAWPGHRQAQKREENRRAQRGGFRHNGQQSLSPGLVKSIIA
jgi:hypothetical protein